MLKLVSWIDSLPRLAAHRRKNCSQSPNQHGEAKRRQEKIKAKSTTSTPLIKHKNDEKSSWKKQKGKEKTLNFGLRGSIGRRRYTEADALSPLRTLSPVSPHIYLTSPLEENMSSSWHPDGIERVQSLRMNNSYCQETGQSGNLISSNPVSCSVQEIVFGDEMDNSSVTLHSTVRPQIRTNPWVRPKSPRVIPALDLSRSGSLSVKRSVGLERPGQSATLKSTKTGHEGKENNGGKDDNSVYSLRSSSGYGSGSQDSSPASSVHTPDWQTLSVSRYGSSNLRNASSNGRLSTICRVSKSREDVALQCDLTEDKSVECNEDDFLPIMDENGNIPMIDDEESGTDDDGSCHENDCHDETLGLYYGLAHQDPDSDLDRISSDLNHSNSKCADPDLGSQNSENLPTNLTHFSQNLHPNQTETSPSPKPFPRQNSSPSSILRKNTSLVHHQSYDRNGNSDSDSSKSNAVLDLLQAKVELLKVSSDQVSQAVRSAKEEQRKRNGELRVYEEQMQFLKQLKLAISNGFEVMV